MLSQQFNVSPEIGLVNRKSAVSAACAWATAASAKQFSTQRSGKQVLSASDQPRENVHIAASKIVRRSVRLPQLLATALRPAVAALILVGSGRLLGRRLVHGDGVLALLVLIVLR